MTVPAAKVYVVVVSVEGYDPETRIESTPIKSLDDAKRHAAELNAGAPPSVRYGVMEYEYRESGPGEFEHCLRAVRA